MRDNHFLAPTHLTTRVLRPQPTGTHAHVRASRRAHRWSCYDAHGRRKAWGKRMLQSFTPSLLPAYAAALFGYLCGSIPFGLIITRLAGTRDIRSIGSGNIGATNVLRTGHKGLAAATLVGDALKGTFAVLAIYSSIRPSIATSPTTSRSPPRSALSSVTSFRSGSASRAARASPPISASCWRWRLASCDRFLLGLARGRGGHPLLLARRARRQRCDAVRAMAARLLAGAGAVRAADGTVVGDASRRHRRLMNGTEGKIGKSTAHRIGEPGAPRIVGATLRRKQPNPTTRTEPSLPYAATVRRRSTASRKRKWPSVPFPTFVSSRSTRFYERRKQRDARKS